jgi:hypothetical protein
VIAEQAEEAMLGKRRRLDTARAERENEPVKRLLRLEQNIRITDGGAEETWLGNTMAHWYQIDSYL